MIDDSTIFKIAPKSVGKKSEPKDRVPDLDEIKDIWREIDKSKCYPTTRNTLKLIMLTGARISEVRRMEKCDLNLKKVFGLYLKKKARPTPKLYAPLLLKH